jgi:hypothetical protein
VPGPVLDRQRFFKLIQYLDRIPSTLPGLVYCTGGGDIMARIETEDRGLSALGAAEKELAPGEKLAWAGRPRASALARRASPGFFIGIPFTAFSLFWVAGAYTATQRDGHDVGPFVFFPLFGLIFVAVGLFMLLSPLRAMARARSTIYAITDQRLLIIEGGSSRRVTSFTAGDIQQIERTERPDGSGDVVFRREIPATRRNSISFNGNWGATRIGFFGVSDVRRVEAAVRDFARKNLPAQN